LLLPISLEYSGEKYSIKTLLIFDINIWHIFIFKFWFLLPMIQVADMSGLYPCSSPYLPIYDFQSSIITVAT
jgi:hypothetical protein